MHAVSWVPLACVSYVDRCRRRRRRRVHYHRFRGSRIESRVVLGAFPVVSGFLANAAGHSVASCPDRKRRRPRQGRIATRRSRRCTPRGPSTLTDDDGSKRILVRLSDQAVPSEI